MWYKYFYLALLAAGLTVLAGCQKMEEVRPQQPGRYTLSVVASKGPDTKSLSLDNGEINAQWAVNEKVAVYQGGTYLGELNVDSVSDGKAILSGQLTGSVTFGVTDQITLIYPSRAWDYRGQNGLLTGEGSISEKYDFAVAQVTVNEVDDATHTITTTSGTFTTQQSIFRLGFKEGENTVTVKNVTIATEQNKLVERISYESGWKAQYASTLSLTLATETNQPFYVSLRNEATVDDQFQFNVADQNGALYTGTKNLDKKNLVNGLFLTSSEISVSAVQLSKGQAPVSDKDKIW